MNSRHLNAFRLMVLAGCCAALLPFSTALAGIQETYRSLYEQGEYEKAVEILEGHLDTQPSDMEARTDLALTLLRMGEKDYAREQIDQLLKSTSAAARRSGETLDGLMTRLARQDKDRERFTAALADLDAVNARALVESMELTSEQKGIILMYVNMYAGDYAAARSVIEAFRPQRFSERKKVQEMRAEIDAAEKRYLELISQVESFWYSGDAVSTFGYASADQVPAIKDFSIPRYLEAVTALAEHAPLSPRVMDITFHAALLAAPQSDLFALGQRILDRKGSLRIPCFSRNLHFDLVIDAASGRLRTESVSRPFVATHTGHGARQPLNKWYAEMVPFDVSFSQIGAISQDLKHNFNIQGLDDGGHVLKLKSGGLVPGYALMPALHMFYGEKAQRAATNNLGQFLVSVAQRSGAAVQAKLIDPEKTTVQKSMIFKAVMSGLASGMSNYAADTGNLNASMQLQQTASLLNTQIAMDAVRGERLAANQASWHRQLAVRGFDFIRSFDFEQVESLLAGE